MAFGFSSRGSEQELREYRLDQRLTIPDHVRVMVEPDGAVVLDLEAGRYFSLNGTGGKIWSEAQEGATVGRILEVLEESFGSRAPREHLLRDLVVF